MKIAFVNNDIYKYAVGEAAAVGGAERQQWLLARALAKAGWSARVGINEGLAVGTRTVIEGVEFVGIGKGWGHILSAWYHFLSSERPDWFYWRCASHLLGPAFAVAKLLGVRTIFSVALDPDVNPRHALVYRSQWWPLYAWGLSWADRIFVQHGTQFAVLTPKLQSKAYIVPSVAGDAVTSKPHSNREKYVAWVGQLRQAKRPDLLIEMARKAPEIRFIVCGGPSDFGSPPGYSERAMEALRKLPNIDYRGQVSPGDAVKAIADAAVLLSTSDEEGFPNIFLQAWSSGTPVVSLKIDPDAIITRKGLGIISSGIESAIVDIHQLVDSVQLREEIAVRSRRYVAQYHSEIAVTTNFGHAILGTQPSVGGVAPKAELVS
jgi:glycosyltransferase involved in cell wall biosynthesis